MVIKVELAILIILIIIDIILMIYNADLEIQNTEMMKKYHSEEENRASSIEYNLKQIAKNVGIEICFDDEYYKFDGWAKLPILVEKVNDLEAFLQSRSCQAKDKEDTQ